MSAVDQDGRRRLSRAQERPRLLRLHCGPAAAVSHSLGLRTLTATVVFCQACGSRNSAEEEFCGRCNHKLLVVSGSMAGSEFESDTPEDFSLDEHLLERISSLEEASRRIAETLDQLVGTIDKLERNALINQAGLSTVRELLEKKKVLSFEEWGDLWESKVNYQLLALEKLERFVSLKGRIAVLHQGKRHDRFLQYLEEAEGALQAFEIEDALESLTEALRLDRSNYELAYFIGETYFNEGETDRALEFFASVLKARPKHLDALVYSAVIHHEDGDDEDAERLLLDAIVLAPKRFLPRFSLGAVYASQSRLDEAIAQLETAIEFSETSHALYLLGNCLYEQGDLAAAIGRLKKAIQLDPGFEDAHHLLGLAYLDRQWNRKALESFRRAQKLNPNKMRYEELVRYLTGQGMGPLPNVSDEAGHLLDLADEAYASNKPERAIGSVRRALDLEPNNPALLMSYATLCLQLDRHEESEAVSRQVLSLQPSEMLKATACATLIEALRNGGRYREGNRIGAQLLDEGETNFAKTIAYYEIAYNLAEMEEDLDRALEYALSSLEHSPDELRQFPLAAVGWVYFKRSDFEQAIEFLTRANKLGPSSKALTHLGMALLATGEKSKARRVLAEARKLGSNGASLEKKMMECMKDSQRLSERVREMQRK